jgi:hypothetical protein
MACMAAKPVVNGIETQYAETLDVIHINVHDPVGRTLTEKFQSEFTPTFVLLDAAGDEIMRTVGAIDPLEVRRILGDPE